MADNTQCSKGQAVSLDTVQGGSRVRVEDVDAGQGLANRLSAMGIFKNEMIKVVRNDGAGQIIVEVKNSKVILGRGMGHKILVVLVKRKR
ncbi:MAG: FeoA family protein [Planctomycetota bacterium]|jgi:ferrous iron transport protein A